MQTGVLSCNDCAACGLFGMGKTRITRTRRSSALSVRADEINASTITGVNVPVFRPGEALRSPTHWKIKMAMQLKHMLTVGLGLGVATALGYQLLSSPQHEAVSNNVSQYAPLNHFELAATPPAETKSAAIPVQPAVDNQFRSEATPLRSSTFAQTAPIESNSSYRELVAEAQATLSDATQPSVESKDSGDGFALKLDSPDTSSEPEFVFQEQADIESSNTLELEQSLAENNLEVIEPQSVEDFGPIAGQMVIEETALTDNSTQAMSSPAQSGSLPLVVDYNSQPLAPSVKEQKSDENVWKENPFINNGQAKATTAKQIQTVSASGSELQVGVTKLPSSITDNEGFPSPIESVELPHTNSLLSLNDPVHEDFAREDFVATAESFQPTVAESVQAMPAMAIPNSIQPQPESRLVTEHLANHTDQIGPSGQLTMNSADTLKAVHHVEYGKTLSRRGAAFTARQEFLAAMQLIATANDKTSGDNRHTKALRLAMLTIKEAGDFSVTSSEQQIQMDVSSVVESHRCRVLTVDQAANLSPVQAMNRYFAKAQEQLDLAGGRNVVSAEVFYCMGKLHTVLSRNKKVLGPYDTARSVVYHQAALLSDSQHHRSSNELGVLLARSGRLEQAKMLFERSLMTQPTVRTWQNLAEAHRRLGEVEFANQAANEVQMLASSQLPPSESIIQWKAIDQFNADAPTDYTQPRVAKLPEQPATSQPSVAPTDKPTRAKSIADRIKGIF